jgi:DNA-binding transcriptional LysR family regulator
VNFRYQNSGRALRWPFRIEERTLEIVPGATIAADASDAVAEILAAGGGIGVVATFIAAPYVQRGELVPVLSEFAVDRSTIAALWPESRRGSLNVKAFVAFLRKFFPRRRRGMCLLRASVQAIKLIMDDRHDRVRSRRRAQAPVWSTTNGYLGTFA